MVGGNSSEETKIATILRLLQFGFGMGERELNQQPEYNSSPSYVQSNLIPIDNNGLINSLITSHPISATSALPLLFFSFSFTLPPPHISFYHIIQLNCTQFNSSASYCCYLQPSPLFVSHHPHLNLLDFIHSVTSFFQRHT